MTDEGGRRHSGRPREGQGSLPDSPTEEGNDRAATLEDNHLFPHSDGPQKAPSIRQPDPAITEFRETMHRGKILGNILLNLFLDAAFLLAWAIVHRLLAVGLKMIGRLDGANASLFEILQWVLDYGTFAAVILWILLDVMSAIRRVWEQRKIFKAPEKPSPYRGGAG